MDQINDADQLARIFKVLSVNTRIRILQLIKERPFCVNALSHRLGISSAAVSQHLRILRDADLVQTEKKGYFVHYQLNEQTLTDWGTAAKDLLTTHPHERDGACRKETNHDV